MYDKARIRIPNTDNTKALQVIQSGKQITDISSGEIYVSGKIGDLNINIHAESISIIGSIAKYINGNNVQNLTREQTQQAIERLSDTLGVDVGKGYVRQLEVGATFTMCHNPAMYFDLLQEMPRFERKIFGDSIYYIQQQKEVYFYDKSKESKAATPTANLLRYEIRYNQRLADQLQWEGKIQAATLYNFAFWQKVKGIYVQTFNKIEKQTYLNDDDMKEIKTVGGAYDLLFARLMAENSNNMAERFIEELKRRKILSKSDIYRLRNKIKKARDLSNGEENFELISELTELVKNVQNYK